MKFVDEITLFAKAGDGGDGVVRWASTRGNPRGGPSGGNGGRGGDVYVRAVRDIGILRKYRGNENFEAHGGGDGGKNSLHGKDGEDVFIDLPIGSVVTIVEQKKTVELLKEDEEVRVLVGGAGGYGNEHFKSSTNVTPKESTPGKSGQASELEIELRLIADAGFMGFPNAGKSSLLNELTRANVRTDNFEFTTLTPNLGVMYGYVLADIPGLIEGASQGKGLGHQFLRHINRVNMAIHCISVEQENVLAAYKTIRSELAAYDKALLQKPELIVLTKSDLVDADAVASKVEDLETLGNEVVVTSIADAKSIKTLRDTLVRHLQKD